MASPAAKAARVAAARATSRGRPLAICAVAPETGVERHYAAAWLSDSSLPIRHTAQSSTSFENATRCVEPEKERSRKNTLDVRDAEVYA
jgi:hypothetical protein